MGRVYAVASGKGGVGKTTTTANLGATLSAAGHRTVVVDADLGMANLGAALGVADEGPTLHDVLAGEASVADAVREPPDRPAVLPGSTDIADFSDAIPDELAGVLDDLADEYEHVLVDTGAGLSADSLAPLRAADEVVLVSTPDPVALDDTAKTATLARRLGTPLRGFVIVRAVGERADRAGERLDGDVLGTIPEDAVVVDAMAEGVPLVEFAPRSPATDAYRRLAADLTGADVPGTGTEDAPGGTEDRGSGGTGEDPTPDAAGGADGADVASGAAAEDAAAEREAAADADSEARAGDPSEPDGAGTGTDEADEAADERPDAGGDRAGDADDAEDADGGTDAERDSDAAASPDADEAAGGTDESAAPGEPDADTDPDEEEEGEGFLGGLFG